LINPYSVTRDNFKSLHLLSNIIVDFSAGEITIDWTICKYVDCVCLTALLHILENPNSLQQWLRDTDMNPLLVQISRIYHAEKYGQ